MIGHPANGRPHTMLHCQLSSQSTHISIDTYCKHKYHQNKLHVLLPPLNPIGHRPLLRTLLNRHHFIHYINSDRESGIGNQKSENRRIGESESESEIESVIVGVLRCWFFEFVPFQKQMFFIKYNCSFRMWREAAE